MPLSVAGGWAGVVTWVYNSCSSYSRPYLRNGYFNNFFCSMFLSGYLMNGDLNLLLNLGGGWEDLKQNFNLTLFVLIFGEWSESNVNTNCWSQPFMIHPPFFYSNTSPLLGRPQNCNCFFFQDLLQNILNQEQLFNMCT